MPARVFGDPATAALVVGTQWQTGTAQGQRIHGHYRGTLVMVRTGAWRLAGVHLSLPQPPTP